MKAHELRLLASEWFKRTVSKRRRQRQERVSLIKTPDTLETRIAVHETGHLVVAWSCSAISAITSVTADSAKSAGRTEAKFNRQHTATEDGLWCQLVLTLAGAAAEARTFGTSVGHLRDAQEALVLAEQLAKIGFTSKEQKLAIDSEVRLPIILGSVEGLALTRAAFTLAWRLIEAKGLAFDRVVSVLITKKTLDESDLRPMLGSRRLLRLSGIYRAGFSSFDD